MVIALTRRSATFLARIRAQNRMLFRRQHGPLPGIGRRRFGAEIGPSFQIVYGVHDTSADLPIRRPGAVRAVLLERATGETR